jgi:hypothetical protein
LFTKISHEKTRKDTKKIWQRFGINILETVGYRKYALKARRNTASPPALKARWKLARDAITGPDTHKIPAPNGAAHLLSPDRRHSSRVRIIVRHVPVISSRANFQGAFSAGGESVLRRAFSAGGEAVFRRAFSARSPIFTVSNMLMPFIYL